LLYVGNCLMVNDVTFCKIFSVRLIIFWFFVEQVVVFACRDVYYINAILKGGGWNCGWNGAECAL